MAEQQFQTDPSPAFPVHLAVRLYPVYISAMIRPLPSHRTVALAFALAVSCWSTASFAQSATAPAAPVATSDIVTLTDEQRMAIIDGNTMESAAAARGELTGSDRAGRGIHGEVGVMIGTNGTRGIYGVANIPLGNNASATLSYENSRYGYRR